MSIEKEVLHQKVSKLRIDRFIMEYDHFLPLLSFYLPTKQLRQNEDFVKWLRSTPGLADQIADTLMYTLPAPR